jgi:hypothetical protein
LKSELRYVAELEDHYGVSLDEQDFDALVAAVEQAHDVEPTLAELADALEAAELFEHAYETEGEDEPEDPKFRELIEREYEALERKLDRSLTEREADAIAKGLEDQDARGQELSAEQALNGYRDSGGKVHDLDTRAGRTAWMAERLAEGRTETAPDNSDREYDLDDRKDRIDYMAARLNGQEFGEVEVAE